jgi:hypothetical protein
MITKKWLSALAVAGVLVTGSLTASSAQASPVVAGKSGDHDQKSTSQDRRHGERDGNRLPKECLYPLSYAQIDLNASYPKARHRNKAKTVTLSGQVTINGCPYGGVQVGLYSSHGHGDGWRLVETTTADRKGYFAFTRSTAGSHKYQAIVAGRRAAASEIVRVSS